MALDLSKVAVQVGAMVAFLKEQGRARRQCLDSALETLHTRTGDLEGLKKKAASARTTWLVADPVQPVTSRFSAPPIPPDFTVMATDGSHIDVDRHRSTRCYLINIGSVVLHYGRQPDASLESAPRLCAGDEDMVIAANGARGGERLIEGALLGIKRAVDECRQLAVLAAAQPPHSINLALLDGSLILWSLEPFPEFVTQELLHKSFLADFERMRQLNADRQMPVASYVSFPRSTDVLNLLRVAICPQGSPDCDRDCPPGQARHCEIVAGIRDRDLFMSTLAEGERSGLFITLSTIVRKHYGAHRVYFFYLMVAGEVARVEVPEWVALSPALLDLTHSLVLDQCRRGQGYPVVLSEAHEQAVLTGADRETFWDMVDSSLTDEHMSTAVSAKSLSKRTRWV